MNRRAIMFASGLLFTVASVSSASAQAVARPSYGVLVGANFAKLSDADDANTRTGVVVGLATNFHLANSVGLEIDGLYSQQGAKEDLGGDDVTLHLDYVQIPVLLRYTFPTHGSVHPFLTAGPQVGFKVKCKLTADDDSADCGDEGGFGEDAKSTDVSGVVGAGINFTAGKQELSIAARYNMGFTKVFDGSESKNRVFSVMAGYAF